MPAVQSRVNLNALFLRKKEDFTARGEEKKFSLEEKYKFMGWGENTVKSKEFLAVLGCM